VVADIPGIIEGAHEGKGLGLQFLRHIERTRSLAFLLPVDGEDLQAEYEQLRDELRRYSRDLAGKPHCVVITKVDLLPPESAVPTVDAPGAWGVFSVSSVARKGLEPFLESLYVRSRPDPTSGGHEGDSEEEWWVPE
jgi:GTP-binding protein